MVAGSGCTFRSSSVLSELPLPPKPTCSFLLPPNIDPLLRAGVLALVDETGSIFTRGDGWLLVGGAALVGVMVGRTMLFGVL